MFEVIEQELESFSHLWHLGCLAMPIIIIIIIIIIHKAKTCGVLTIYKYTV
jgi:hypothetical protein